MRRTVSRLAVGAALGLVYSVDVTLRQQIRLARDRTIESFAVTWSDTRQVGAVPAKVDQFVQAWETVNQER